ncbi:MAG: hypothetical protein UR98_C0004G0038 [Parcubacteria group bacterium GW2011_GWA1_36_12]|nr:MAG: hypothetical protein UR98_C0004G0038 [Parcubacteria group bacterium GW2011_GWA1_36_12]
MNVKVEDLRAGNTVWVDGYMGIILTIAEKPDWYNIYFKIPQGLPLADFYLSKLIKKNLEMELIG